MQVAYHSDFWSAISTLTPILLFAYLTEVRLVVRRDRNERFERILAGLTTSAALVGIVVVLIWTLTSLSEQRDDHRPQAAIAIILFTTFSLVAQPVVALVISLLGRPIFKAFGYTSPTARHFRRSIRRLNGALKKNEHALWRQRAANHRTLAFLTTIKTLQEIAQEARDSGRLSHDDFRQVVDVAGTLDSIDVEIGNVLHDLEGIREKLSDVHQIKQEALQLVQRYRNEDRRFTDEQVQVLDKLLKDENARHLQG